MQSQDENIKHNINFAKDVVPWCRACCLVMFKPGNDYETLPEQKPELYSQAWLFHYVRRTATLTLDSKSINGNKYINPQPLLIT